MRHNKAFNHLGRKTGHRKAMLANMASSLLLHKRIETTLAKAKALRVYVEPLITQAVTELFRVIAPKIAYRPGGYLRILKTGFRAGDGADMALVELVDFNEAALASTTKKEEVKKPATRRSRAKKAAPKAEEAKAEVKVEEAKAEEPKAESKPAAEAPAAEEQKEN